MRVLHVISTLAVSYGGPTRAVQEMRDALLRKGVHVEIATSSDNGSSRYSLDPSSASVDARRDVESGLVHRFAKKTDFYRFTPSFARWMHRNVREYDLIHVHGLFNFISVTAARAARSAGVPYVIRPYGTLNHYGITKRRPLLKKLSIRLVEGPILRDAAFVHFTAEAEKAEAEQLGIHMRSVVIPLGIDNSRISFQLDGQTHFPGLAQSPVLLYLSRLSPKKNLESLLRAVSSLVDTHPDLKLLIAGSGDKAYVDQLKALVQELGIQKSVVWAGFVEGDRKAAALASADCFILPSYSENFGIAAAEALMAGLPCILAHGVALAPSVQSVGAGFSIDPQPESIVHAVRKVLADDALHAEMSRRARAFAEATFSADAMGDRLIKMYKTVLADPRPMHTCG